jgi:hypothetical protein
MDVYATLPRWNSNTTEAFQISNHRTYNTLLETDLIQVLPYMYYHYLLEGSLDKLSYGPVVFKIFPLLGEFHQNTFCPKRVNTQLGVWFPTKHRRWGEGGGGNQGGQTHIVSKINQKEICLIGRTGKKTTFSPNILCQFLYQYTHLALIFNDNNYGTPLLYIATH